MKPEARRVLHFLRQAAVEQGGIQALSRKTGLHRVNLNRMLSDKGNPEFKSLVAIAQALGLEVTLNAAGKHAADGDRDSAPPQGFPSPGIS